MRRLHDEEEERERAEVVEKVVEDQLHHTDHTALSAVPAVIQMQMIGVVVAVCVGETSGLHVISAIRGFMLSAQACLDPLKTWRKKSGSVTFVLSEN